MRTTLDIEDDVLAAAKELARRERKSAGAVLSELARRALTGAPASGTAPARSGRKPAVAGFRAFPARGKVVTDELIDALRDAEGL
ncbi:MAG: hypothetical protein H0W40_01955 [Methylibium sp.]|uniref:CopG family transcriptional regulator n=1 Tax=Methylibium sp. TaxID=2067992 RepID=UPI00184C1022|nr:CopG family transcriptional regulator [Methylibium sp.]MBA3596132.1 hypothetical protein [Methylibium sp.]